MRVGDVSSLTAGKRYARLIEHVTTDRFTRDDPLAELRVLTEPFEVSIDLLDLVGRRPVLQVPKRELIFLPTMKSDLDSLDLSEHIATG